MNQHMLTSPKEYTEEVIEEGIEFPEIYSGGETPLQEGHRHTALSRFFPKGSRGANFFQVEEGSGMDNIAHGIGSLTTPLGDWMAKYLISPIADLGAEHIGEEYYPKVDWNAIKLAEKQAEQDELWRQNQTFNEDMNHLQDALDEQVEQITYHDLEEPAAPDKAKEPGFLSHLLGATPLGQSFHRQMEQPEFTDFAQSSRKYIERAREIDRKYRGQNN